MNALYTFVFFLFILLVFFKSNIFVASVVLYSISLQVLLSIVMCLILGVGVLIVMIFFLSFVLGAPVGLFVRDNLVN